MGDQGSYTSTNIGNYRILGHIGNGGFGSVYRGEHSILKERVVAIKILHTHLGSPAERDRFLEEARLLGHIHGPHILQIFDAGLENGLPYLVTEYAPHGSLRDILIRHAHTILPEDVSLSILSQIGEALYYAHQQHIVHRDLKPENILFNAKNEALLADFGIATTLSTSSVKYSSVIGTPSYMAPEQFQGTVSKEGDQYALGCIAYELFTGHVPFSAPDFFAMGFKHLTDQPVAPTQFNPALPAHIERAILKAMAKKRGERHADVRAFLTALHGSADARGLSDSSTLSAFNQTQKHTTGEALVTLPIAHLIETATFVREKPPHLDQQSHPDMLRPLSTPRSKLEEKRNETGGALPIQQITPPLESTWNGVPAYQPYHSQQGETGRRKMILASACAAVVMTLVASLLFVALPNFLHAHIATRTTSSLTTTHARSTATVHTTSLSGRPTRPIATSAPVSLPTSSPTGVSIFSPTGTATSTSRPTPTSTPIPSVTSIDDSITGTDLNQWNYVGANWRSCTNCNETNPTVTFYDASQHWDPRSTDTATITFSGTQIKFYGATASWHGIGAISIDGGAETNVDFYSANKTGDVLLWTSPVLAKGVHTFKMRITGTHDTASTGIMIVIDRVVIVS